MEITGRVTALCKALHNFVYAKRNIMQKTDGNLLIFSTKYRIYFT